MKKEYKGVWSGGETARGEVKVAVDWTRLKTPNLWFRLAFHATLA